MSGKNPLDQLLSEHGLSRYQVSKISGIKEGQLFGSSRREVNRWTVKTVQAVAMALGMTAGEALDELLKREGNPIVRFIRAHPFLDDKLVNQMDDLLIEAHDKGVNIKTITFNRYYDEGDDTNERAEQAIKNVIATIQKLIED